MAASGMNSGPSRMDWASVESSHECWLGTCRRLTEVRVDFRLRFGLFHSWVESICTRVRQLEALGYE